MKMGEVLDVVRQHAIQGKDPEALWFWGLFQHHLANERNSTHMRGTFSDAVRDWALEEIEIDPKSIQHVGTVFVAANVALRISLEDVRNRKLPTAQFSRIADDMANAFQKALHAGLCRRSA